MVNNTFTSLAEFSKNIFSKYVSVPEAIANPIFVVPYGIFIFLIIFLISILISRFVGIKKTFYLLFLIFIISFLFGGFYFSIMMLIISLPLLFIAKIKKGEGEFGGEEGGKMEEMPGLEEKGGFEEKGGLEEKGGFEEKGGLEEEKPFEEEKGLGEEGGKMEEIQGFEEEKPQIQPQQKVCPYCGTPLIWVPQYQRYYCPKCRRYL